jgi:predicted dehydrogenase
MLVDTGVHDFDLARWLMGDEVILVQAVATHKNRDWTRSTASCVNLAFAQGAIGSIETIWGVIYGDDVRTEIVGSDGTLSIGTATRLPVRLMTQAGIVQEGYRDHFDEFSDSYLNELRSFVDVVHEGGVAKATLEDGIRALQLALAARESLENDMASIVPRA